MDFKNFETTSIYAIEAVYQHLWKCVPEVYRLIDDNPIEEITRIDPFYDPELTFENRTQYRLSKIEYPKRAKPWYIITWNSDAGLLKSTLTQRRFETATFEKDGKYYDADYINAELQVNFGVVSNSMSAIFEFQENYILKQREKQYIYTPKEHSILGSFPVSMDVLDSNQQKLSRDKGTIAYLFLQCKVDYPVIGNVREVEPGRVIREIHNRVGSLNTMKLGTHDVITEADLDREFIQQMEGN